MQPAARSNVNCRTLRTHIAAPGHSRDYACLRVTIAIDRTYRSMLLSARGIQPSSVGHSRRFAGAFFSGLHLGGSREGRHLARVLEPSLGTFPPWRCAATGSGSAWKGQGTAPSRSNFAIYPGATGEYFCAFPRGGTGPLRLRRGCRPGRTALSIRLQVAAFSVAVASVPPLQHFLFVFSVHTAGADGHISERV